MGPIGGVHMAESSDFTATEFAAALNVSRETMARLQAYEALLREWQNRINLVSASTLSDLWRRHFYDCGQLCRFIEGRHSVVDIGSGAGFPGLVISIMTGANVTLIESDNRKAVFLREAARLTGAAAQVVADRAEKVDPVAADVITARAVASVADLLALSEPWLKPGGRCLFLKGASVADELTDASRIWDIEFDQIPSLSDPSGFILHIKEFRHG